MKQINIIQFTPYFPPHKGGLETVGQEISKYWVYNNYGDFINVTTEFDQQDHGDEKIIFKGQEIGYKKDGYQVLVCPSIEIVYNFPIYKFWDQKYKMIQKYLRSCIEKSNCEYRVITHTRFFLPTFFGGLFARKNNIPWLHIEHGSGYAKLGSKFKTYVGIIYDHTLGKWSLKKADIILPISKACEKFVLQIGGNISHKTHIFYRGLDLDMKQKEKKDDIKLVFVGRLVSLKGVADLIEAYIASRVQQELVIIGDGDEAEKLKQQAKGHDITFLGFQKSDFVIDFLNSHNCIFINPSYQEGLPTTVIEGLATRNVVIATDVGGTKEISEQDDLMIINSGDIQELKNKILYALENYSTLKGLSLENVNEKFNWDNNIKKLYRLANKYE
ncbi:glycosyltransferase family 4 protein [Candidatus Gracilibacteria bacterium]|nr:glycosyltransferase family 4 protein [Candidatus Gracilibacteria bacterium]